MTGARQRLREWVAEGGGRGDRLLAGIVLLALGAILATVNNWWVHHNLLHVPPGWDQAFYINLGLNEYDLARRGDLVGLLHYAATESPWVAPLVPLTTVPFFAVFGPSTASAYMVNGAYLLLLLAAVFFAGRQLAGTSAGALAVLLCLAFPAFIAFPRDYLYEFPLAAVTAAAYCLVVTSDGFRARSSSVWAGVAVGCGLLIKTMAAAFYAVPAAFAIAALIRPGEEDRRKNAALFLGAALLVAAPYYLLNFNSIFGYLIRLGFSADAMPYAIGIDSVLSWRNWTIYAEQIVLRGISLATLWLTGAVIVARLLGGRERRPGRGYGVVWAWLIAGYLVLSLTPNKGGGCERYAQPIMPAIAILLAVNVSLVPRPWLRRALVTGAVVIAAANFAFQTATSHAWYHERDPYFLAVHHTFGFQVQAESDPGLAWDPGVLVRAVEERAGPGREPVIVLVGANHWFLNPANISLAVTLERMRGRMPRPIGVRTIDYGPWSEGQIAWAISRSDFVVTKSGTLGPEPFIDNCKVLSKLLAATPPIASFPMNDGSEALLFANPRRR